MSNLNNGPGCTQCIDEDRLAELRRSMKTPKEHCEIGAGCIQCFFEDHPELSRMTQNTSCIPDHLDRTGA